MKDEMNATQEQETGKNLSRRKFLGYAGGIAGAGLLISSCKKEDDDVVPEPGAIDLGTNDDGLTNLMFVSQQIETDLYSKILTEGSLNMTDRNEVLMTDIYQQEVTHREFLRNYLKGRGTIVETDFSSINFSSPGDILSNLLLIENTIAGLFAEIGRLYAFSDNAAIVAKLASVEARHAATISNMMNKGDFFGPVDEAGLEPGILPSNAVITFNKYLATKVTGNNLPNT